MSDLRSARRLRILLLLAYCLGVLYFGTSRSNLGPELNVPDSDKYLHALVFGGLGVLALRAITVLLPAAKSWVRGALAVGFAAFWGGLLEVVQSLTTYRLAEWGDFAADVLGAAVLVLLAMLLRLDRSLLRSR